MKATFTLVSINPKPERYIRYQRNNA
jgi:hypothetical protein